MASKFEQYLEILNNKQSSRRVGDPTEEGSPLRTKQYMKTLNGETPSLNTSPIKQGEEQPSAKEILDYDLTEAQMRQ